MNLSVNNSLLSRKLDVVERQTRPKRRRSSGSESSDGEGRKRSRSSSESRSKRRGSWRRGRSRDTSISSFKKSRGNDMEKLLVQINDSIGVLADKVEQVGLYQLNNYSVTCPIHNGTI